MSGENKSGPLTDAEFKKMKYLLISGEKLSGEVNEFIISKHVSLTEVCVAVIRLSNHMKESYPELYKETEAVVALMDKAVEEEKNANRPKA